MDNSKIVFLINDAARAVKAIYEEQANVQQRSYIFKTLDSTIQVDDMVVVETNTRHGFTVVKIVEVDVDVNFDDPVELKWVVGKVVLTDFNLVKAQEADAISAVQAAELRRKKAELRATMFKDHEESIANLALSTPALPAE